MAFAVPAAIYGIGSTVAPGFGASLFSTFIWAGSGVLAVKTIGVVDNEIKRNKKKELIRKTAELKRENFEIESMDIEDKYSFDLRVYKNRRLKLKNIQRNLKDIQRNLKDSSASINKALKKKAFSLLKVAWKIIKNVQFKGTGDLLSNWSWSFETHNHINFDNISINPSLVGIISSDNNPNKIK